MPGRQRVSHPPEGLSMMNHGQHTPTIAQILCPPNAACHGPGSGRLETKPTVVGVSPSTTHQAAASSPPFSLPLEVTQIHVLSSRLGQTPSKVWHQDLVQTCPVLGQKARPPGGGLCMIKVTSKIGSHKRGQSFAIDRPDSVGCPTRKRSVCPLASAAGWTGSSTGPSPPPANTIRYARPRVGWFSAALGRGGGEGRGRVWCCWCWCCWKS